PDRENDEISSVLDREFVGASGRTRRAVVVPRREIDHGLRQPHAKVVDAEWSGDGWKRKAWERRALHADCGEIELLGRHGRVADEIGQQRAARHTAQTARLLQ